MKKSEIIAGNVAGFVDDRLGAAKWLKKNLNKVFPDHWSFMLGEITLYSFIILLLLFPVRGRRWLVCPSNYGP